MTNSDNRFLSLIPSTVLDQASDYIGRLLLREYGSVFVAGNGVAPPDRLIYKDENEVAEFQKRVDVGSVEFVGVKFELQKQAADALKDVVDEALRSNLSITPRAPDSGRRSYNETVGLWHSRVEPALDHWTAFGKISPEESAIIRSLPPFDQVPIVLSLEQKGIYFSKDFSKSIIYSVAPPGASQHLSMLAFDVTEFNDSRVRRILTEHRWYQTVVSDLPHFTYLGYAEDELTNCGLKKIESCDREFWLPDIDQL